MSDLEDLPDWIRVSVESNRRIFGTDAIGMFVGEHPAIVAARQAVRTLQRVPSGHRPPAVHIVGESGTGKTCLVSLLHFQGPRRDKGLADSHWTDLPESDLERQLFGHADWHRGMFHAMREGGILIERVGRFPERLQAELLRVVRDGLTRRPGTDELAPAGTWVISTSEGELESRIREGRFSRALFQALAEVLITLPPLRERSLDVIWLAKYFIARRCVYRRLDHEAMRLSPDAIDALLSHTWPGNVAELERVIEGAVDVARQGRINGADLGI